MLGTCRICEYPHRKYSRQDWRPITEGRWIGYEFEDYILERYGDTGPAATDTREGPD